MDKSKSIFMSKTFWFNLAASAAVISGTLPPSKGALIAATAANIGLRLITSQPVAVVPETTTNDGK